MHEELLAAARRRMMMNSAGVVAPQYRPWKDGRSAPGGTPAKNPPQDFQAVPAAPTVATRSHPGTVPMRRKGYRPEVMPNRL